MLEGPRTIEPEIESLRREASEDMKSAYTAILAIVRARQGKDFETLEAEALGADHRMGHFHHVFHFLAEARAIRGDVRRAAELLEMAVDSGMPCAPCFDKDPILAPVHGTPEYSGVRAKIERRNAADRAALKDVL